MIGFLPGAHELHLGPLVPEHGRAEIPEDGHMGADPLRNGLGQGDAAPFDDDVDVLVLPA